MNDSISVRHDATLVWIGSTIDGCSGRLGILRRPTTRHATVSRPPSPDSDDPLSDNPGTIQRFPERRQRVLPDPTPW
jgi:hypothetical protein